MGVEPVLFTIFGILAVGAAISVIALKNPIHSALALVLTFFALAGLFIVLGAHFVAAVQVIVYAGAIMVLFLFVIMLLNLGSLGAPRHINKAMAFAVVLGVILAAEVIYIGVNVYDGTAVERAARQSTVTGESIIPDQLEEIEAIEAMYQLDRSLVNADYVPQVAAGKNDVTALTASEAQQLITKLQRDMGKTDRIGTVLFDKFLLPFEVTSFVLLAALIGVIALMKRERPRPAA